MGAIVELAHIEGDASCFFTKKILWGLGLYLELGSFKEANWRTYKRISDEARIIRNNLKPGKDALKKFSSKLTFEHVRTFHDMVNMLNQKGRDLTIEGAAEIIGEYPAMLITTNENKAMEDRGFKYTGLPEERYAHISFSGFTLRSAGFG